jgi:hypothetical protein
MRERFREQLQKEMTRGQFLQIMAGLLLSIFGFNNLLALFGSNEKSAKTASAASQNQYFGTRKFGK